MPREKDEKEKQRAEAEASSLETGHNKPYFRMRNSSISGNLGKYTSACRSFVVSSCGTPEGTPPPLRVPVPKKAASRNSSSESRPRLPCCRFRRRHFLGSPFPRCRCHIHRHCVLDCIRKSSARAVPGARFHSPTSSYQALKPDSENSAWSHQSFACIMISVSKRIDDSVCLERICCGSDCMPLLHWILQQIGQGFDHLLP